MKRIEPTLLGKLISEIVSSDQTAQQALLESRALSYWREVVGELLAEQTQKLTLRDGKLYVVFSSAAARNDFFLRRQYIKDELNRLVGQKVVTFISVSNS